MSNKPRQDSRWLLSIAKAVASELQLRGKGTSLRIRIPSRVHATHTDGWRVVIGDFGKKTPSLEIWFDRFSGYPERKLYACFSSDVRLQITSITKRVSEKLWPIRVVNLKDISYEKQMVLVKRLARSEFSVPILEKHFGGSTYYGIYDPTRETAERLNPRFCARAAAFFEDVARTLPHAIAEDVEREVYPQCENRKRVASHLQRERSRLLAIERKIRDDYACQVCGLRFEDRYGKLGIEFAEAHHIVPLSQLRENVRTSIDDLTTVCGNCHRMLHRMEGERGDIEKLSAIVRKHKK